ncbi:MAG: CHAT domain-containing protein [Thermoflexibacteraceae bacterium]
MLNSGVVLAGVSNYYRSAEKPATEDGILTAHEAQNLHLDQTNLVILSACETALGEVRHGEGVYGLQRAFKVAGAKSILTSHWKVDDRVTQELMTAFYANCLRMGNKRQAFLAAQQEIRKKYPQSFFLAFAMVGE